MLIVVVLPPWLNRATATSPLVSGLARPRVPSLLIWLACRPSVSWLMAIRSGSSGSSRVAGDMVRTSLPAISGAAIMAHSAKWLRISVSFAAAADLHHVGVVELRRAWRTTASGR